MKRILSFALIFLIAITLASDIGVLLTYLMDPDALAFSENVSFLHYYLLHMHGLEFAIFRAVFSSLLLVFWFWKFIFPSPADVLKYATFAYALMWVLIGTMVITGVLGALQFVAGLPVDLLDFSILIVAVGQSLLALYVLITFASLLLLASLPVLYNNCFKAEHAPPPLV